jgi:light-regulated signal transduction histidine kinase (bacteriophytochrome)
MMALYAQKLERQCAGVLNSVITESLHYIVEGAQQMERLVSDLLSYTRATASPVTHDSVTDANEAVEKALLNLRSSVEESGAQVTFENLPIVRVADSALVQLFQNLIGNSIKYRSQESPRIEIYAKQQGSHSKICVRDNGIGIAPEYHAHVFGLFKRLHLREQYPGTGIGLSLCQRIVERVGGQIWVESEGEGKGSTFCFTLPC